MTEADTYRRYSGLIQRYDKITQAKNPRFIIIDTSFTPSDDVAITVIDILWILALLHIEGDKFKMIIVF